MESSIDEQRRQKTDFVRRLLSERAIAFPEPTWHPSGRAFGYRNRLRLRVQSDGSIAFFNANKALSCAVLEPELGRLLRFLRALSLEHSRWFAPFSHLEIRAPDSRGRPAVCFYSGAQTPSDSGIRSELELRCPELLVAFDGEPPEQIARQRVELAADVFAWVPVDAFMQINADVNRALVGTLRELASRHEVQTFADFYAGAGNLSLPLLKDGRRGVVSELQASAVHALRDACAEQGMTRVTSSITAAERASLGWLAQGASFDLVIIDGPRAGVRHGLAELARLSAKHIALCSCNAQTFARDLETLGRSGFAIQKVMLFDMFPQTRHVEILAWLARAAPAPAG